MLFDAPTKLDFVDREWLCGGGEKVKGASVLEVETGWYRDPVVTCDYSSLYPRIIISRNLCPSTILLDEVESTPSERVPPDVRATLRTFRVEERDDAVVYHHHVIQRGENGEREGVFPVVARTLLEQRAQAKREMKAHKEGSAAYELLDAKQQALKVLCNSLYGALNAVLKTTIYCRPLGAIVTSEGRLAIAAIERAVDEHPVAKRIAGDTDSVMFLLKGHSIAEAEAAGTALAKTVTDRLRACRCDLRLRLRSTSVKAAA